MAGYCGRWREVAVGIELVVVSGSDEWGVWFLEFGGSGVRFVAWKLLILRGSRLRIRLNPSDIKLEMPAPTVQLIARLRAKPVLAAACTRSRYSRTGKPRSHKPGFSFFAVRFRFV